MSQLFDSALLMLLTWAGVVGQVSSPLKLEGSIELPGVQGRIDHLAIDVPGRRLFVAALGNNSVEVIDLKTNRLTSEIKGLAEPQGVLYLAKPGRLYVANGQGGMVTIFDGASLKKVETVDYKDDADNVRYDAAHDRIYVGYGSGALGELTPEGKQIAQIPLDSHPESFQLEKNEPRIFVNLPKSRSIAVIDREQHKVISRWSTSGPESNYPMALDETDHRLIVLCRQPARLVVLDTTSGHVVANVETVGDADDVFYDQNRKRVYAIGGQGAVWTYQQQDADHYRFIAGTPTMSGARTGLYSPDLDRLYVAVRRGGARSAEIRIYQPQR